MVEGASPSLPLSPPSKSTSRPSAKHLLALTFNLIEEMPSIISSLLDTDCII